MDASKDVEPITTLKRDASELIERAPQNGKATAVLQDIASFERQRQALLMLKLLAHGQRDYEAGRTLSAVQARRRFDKKLRSLDERER